MIIKQARIFIIVINVECAEEENNKTYNIAKNVEFAYINLLSSPMDVMKCKVINALFAYNS